MSLPGDWRQFRRDPTLTGRSPLIGDITTPAVKWRHFIGARETLVSLRTQKDASTDVALPDADVHADRHDAVLQHWGVNGPWHDLDGDGRLTAIPEHTTHKIGHFLPDRPGLQKLEFDSGFEKCGTSAPDSFPLVGRLSARERGQWKQLWETEPIPKLYFPNVIIGDFDNDGRLEAAVTPWNDVWVIDVATGHSKARGRFRPPEAKSGRAYGWLGAFDLNGDGLSEFVILANFENHMEVLGWKDGKLEILWQRLIEYGITRKKTILDPGLAPVADVDGDGRPEIVISLFNDTDDDQWHVLALDGMTGQTKLDLPGCHLAGLCDIDGDGVSELFCTATKGSLECSPSDPAILSFKDGSLSTIWQTDGASFQTQPLAESPLNVSWSPAMSRNTLLAGPAAPDGTRTFLTREPLDDESIRLTLWQSDPARKIAQAGTVTGPSVEALALRTDEHDGTDILIRACIPDDRPAALLFRDVAGEVIVSRRTGVDLSTPVVGKLTPDARPAVVVQADSETVTAFRPSAGGNGKAVTLWRRPGRGIYNVHLMGGGVLFAGAMLADLGGDGTLATLTATHGCDGCARLAAIAPGGSEIWRHDFARVTGDLPDGSRGSLLAWFAGRFTDPTRTDVMATIRTGSMHSEETFLLDGRSGDVLWHRTDGGLSGDAKGVVRACGGSWMAIYDHDGDGLDDALCMYPDVVYVIHGPTGRLILDRHTRGDIFPKAFYAMPIVTDFLSVGQSQMLYGASPYALGVLDMGGDVIWQEGPAASTTSSLPSILPGIGDVDGDGRIELLSPGHRCDPHGSTEQEFHCYDAATGEVKWKLPLPGSCFGPNGQLWPGIPMTPAVADIDGDGRDECVFAIENTLCAIGASPGGKSGEIKWTLDLPQTIGPAAIADVDGTGRPQIVVVCADGHVYGIGAA